MLLIAALLSSALIIIQAGRVLDESAVHQYSYRVTLSSSGNTSPFTFMVPVGSSAGSSVVADAIEKGGMIGIPRSWHVELLNTSESIYLKLSGPGLSDTHYPPPLPVPEEADIQVLGDVPHFGPYSLQVIVDSHVEIPTRQPSGRAPLIQPRMNVSVAECPVPHPVGMPVSAETYSSPVYVRYNTEREHVLFLTVEMEGRNSWWMGGWNGNSYLDRLTLDCSGSQSGWLPAQGILVAGLGNY